jgi:hypothetical protein
VYQSSDEFARLITTVLPGTGATFVKALELSVDVSVVIGCTGVLIVILLKLQMEYFLNPMNLHFIQILSAFYHSCIHCCSSAINLQPHSTYGCLESAESMLKICN